MRPHVVRGGRADEPDDPRVAAVLEVLAGRSPVEVAQRYAVEPPLLHRWVRAFVDAGTAQVTNRPDADGAQSRDRFLAAFAHEVRTPLTVAQGWATLLLDEDLSAEQLATTVVRLHRSLARLSEHALDVELLAAASLGRLRLSPRRTTVADLVAGLSLPGLVDTEIGGDGPATALTVDPRLFARVVRDLWITGGLEPAPTRLRMEAEVIAPWVEVRVVRDADPVEPRVLQALFDPFDLNDDGTGVTMGLYLARALTVAHAGTLGVSQDESGAVFWVRVPVTPTLEPEPGRSFPSSPSSPSSQSSQSSQSSPSIQP